MQGNVVVIGGARADNTAPAVLSFKEQIRFLEERDAARCARRLERLEAKKRAEAEPAALSCQRDNISRTYRAKNTSYYNRSAVALEVNVARWVLSIGKKYSPRAVIAQLDAVGYTPELLDVVEQTAKNHVAELTITIPHTHSEDLAAARRRFTQAFNEFNRRILKERLADYFGDYVRVFEAHKDGVLHAHIIIECKHSMRRGSLPFKWRPNGNVDGSTVAPWVSDIWRQFRAGEFAACGIGERHTLQPIKKGVKCFSKYIAKYITKGLAARPEYMRGLRTVAYSQGFLDGCRLMAYDYDKSERVSYFSKTQGRWLTRYRRYCGFDIECASRRVQRVRLNSILRYLGVSLARLKERLGCKWAWRLRWLLARLRIDGKRFAAFSKWEKFAALRNLCGDSWACVLRFFNGNQLYQFEDFKKLDNEIKTKREFNVVGFIQNGIFLCLETVLSCTAQKVFAELKALKKDVSNALSDKHVNEFQNEKERWLRARKDGLMSRKKYAELKFNWRKRYAQVAKVFGCLEGLPDKLLPRPVVWKPRKSVSVFYA